MVLFDCWGCVIRAMLLFSLGSCLYWLFSWRRFFFFQMFFQHFSGLKLLFIEQLLILPYSQQIIPLLCVCIDKRHLLDTRRPKLFRYILHIATILTLDSIFTDMLPHIIINFLPSNFDLLQRILGHKIGNDTIPSPPDQTRHGEYIARKQPASIRIARKRQNLHNDLHILSTYTSQRKGGLF